VAANFRQRPRDFKPGGNYFWDMEVARLAAGQLEGTFSDAPERPLAAEISGLSPKGP
jgi:hypothetical protein